MAANIQCPPGTERVGMECIPLSGRPASRSAIEAYKQYQQDLPQYQAPGQGTYTGPGTGAFHPFYGIPGRTQSLGVLSTPYVEGAPGYAGGHSGYDPTAVGLGYRVQETPKITNAPFSYGGPTGISGPIVNVGDLLSNASGGRRAPSAGIPAGNVSGGGGLFNLGDLFGGGVPAGAPGGGGLSGGVSRGAPSRGGKGANGTKKGAGGAKKGGGSGKGSGSAGTIPIP